MDRLRYLAPDGALVGGIPPPLDLQATIDAFKAMSLCRRFDERAIRLQRQGRLGTFPPTWGQEACAIGSSMAVDPSRDWLVPQYRELGALLRHGSPLENWLMVLRGDARGHVLPKEVLALPGQIALAAQLPHAVGLGWGLRLQGSDAVVVVYFGDGASSEGDFHEACNLAAVVRAPVIFFLQNNGWAISTPRSAQSAATSLASRGAGYGMPGVLIDGNDLFAVYQATVDAVARARAGDGPTLIEAETYRLWAHNTADDHHRYVEQSELDEKQLDDPLVRLRIYLEGQGVRLDQDDLTAEHDREIDRALAAADAAPPVDPADLFRHVYSNPPPRLRRQELELLGNGEVD